jgi:SAM-dependent methyltransferase
MMTLLSRLFPRDLHHMDGFHQQVQRSLPARGKVLDLGCGANIELASYRTRQREVWGVDFQAHPRLLYPEWFRLLSAEGVIPFPDGSFDLVTSIWVLEHVRRPGEFLAEVARVLRPRGHFIAHTISGSHYVTWLRRLIGLLPHRFNQRLVQKLYGRASHDTFPAYYRLNRRRQVERACKAAGLELVQLDRYADPGYFRFSKMLRGSAVVLDRLLEWIAGGWGRIYFTATIGKPKTGGGRQRRGQMKVQESKSQIEHCKLKTRSGSL